MRLSFLTKFFIILFGGLALAFIAWIFMSTVSSESTKIKSSLSLLLSLIEFKTLLM